MLSRYSGPLWAAAILVTILASTAATAQRASIIADGKEDLDWHCATCHGGDGQGKGEMAKLLIKPPADLTSIAGRNGGEFPFWRVYDIIVGQKSVPGHETFQMPNFWNRLRGDDNKPGFVPAYLRILVLTHYLQSLQTR